MFEEQQGQEADTKCIELSSHLALGGGVSSESLYLICCVTLGRVPGFSKF